MDKNAKMRMVMIVPMVVVALVIVTVVYAVLQPANGPVAANGETPVVEDGVVMADQQPSCAFDFMIGMTGEQVLESVRPLDRPYRIMGPHDPATMDFNPLRINIITDEETGMVTAVTCG